jgi:hypothetical protein
MGALKLSDLQTGDTIEICSNGFLPSIIRKITGSWFNHTETVKVTDLGGDLYYQVVGARDEGVVPAPLADYLLNPKIEKVKIIRYDYVVDSIRKEIYNQMVRLEGSAGYDYKDLLWDYLKSYARLKLTGKWKWSGNKSTDKFACWQLTQYFHQSIFPTWWDARAKEFEEKPHRVIYQGKPTVIL